MDYQVILSDLFIADLKEIVDFSPSLFPFGS
jgi:hypothetical protein